MGKNAEFTPIFESVEKMRDAIVKAKNGSEISLLQVRGVWGSLLKLLQEEHCLNEYIDDVTEQEFVLRPEIGGRWDSLLDLAWVLVNGREVQFMPIKGTAGLLDVSIVERFLDYIAEEFHILEVSSQTTTKEPHAQT